MADIFNEKFLCHRPVEYRVLDLKAKEKGPAHSWTPCPLKKSLKDKVIPHTRPAREMFESSISRVAAPETGVQTGGSENQQDKKGKQNLPERSEGTHSLFSPPNENESKTVPGEYGGRTGRKRLEHNELSRGRKTGYFRSKPTFSESVCRR
ncbi:MAG: hypothetical protein L0196_02345 [candidate division Zixibacteria bacterium]|nr:hypothetical protein [candidate division Zixibacteria bacterium]